MIGTTLIEKQTVILTLEGGN